MRRCSLSILKSGNLFCWNAARRAFSTLRPRANNQLGLHFGFIYAERQEEMVLNLHGLNLDREQ